MIPETENPQEEKSVCSDQPAWHDYADPGRYFTLSPQCGFFSRNGSYLYQKTILFQICFSFTFKKYPIVVPSVILTLTASMAILRLFKNKTDSGKTTHDELSRLKIALFAFKLSKYSNIINAKTKKWSRRILNIEESTLGNSVLKQLILVQLFYEVSWITMSFFFKSVVI